MTVEKITLEHIYLEGKQHSYFHTNAKKFFSVLLLKKQIKYFFTASNMLPVVILCYGFFYVLAFFPWRNALVNKALSEKYVRG
jgi:hypothetical protein